MIAITHTFSVAGMEGQRTSIEVDIRSGLPSFSVVGVDDAAVREARERVRAALLNCGFEFPQRRITVSVSSLASGLRGNSALDLPIAIAVLAASGQVSLPANFSLSSFGELGLDGAVHPVRGVLAVAEASSAAGDDLLIVPRANLQEAQLAGGKVASISRLADLPQLLASPNLAAQPAAAIEPPAISGPDLQDLRGHALAIRALTIAAAGGHSIFFEGPPGCGKTMLARRLPSILPPMTFAEALEVTKIQSVAGNLRVDGLARQRPFRAPHHTASASSLLGGGVSGVPGELTLASGGVMFLDEVTEFSTRSLEALSSPLDEGKVCVTRGNQSYFFPARAQLVVAANPCPCGSAPSSRCRCSASELARFRRRLSLSLLRRFDMRISVARPTPAEVEAGPIADSATVRALVTKARTRQTERFVGTEFTSNASLDASATRKLLRLPDAARELLSEAYRADRLTLRGYDRALRVARTIADLDDRDELQESEVAEALTFTAPTQETEF